MLVDEARYRSRVEETAAAHPVGRQHLVQVPAERAAPPFGERNAKALLAAPEDGGREAVGERALEQSLQGAKAGQLQPRGDPPQELDEGVVEERGAELESGRHARAVGVHQILPGEIVLAVLVDQPSRGVPRLAGREHGRDVSVRVEAAQPGAYLAGE